MTMSILRWSDNSDEEKKGRMNWTEKEDLKLVGAWLRNSVDPVKENAQKDNDLRKKIVAYTRSEEVSFTVQDPLHQDKQVDSALQWVLDQNKEITW